MAAAGVTASMIIATPALAASTYTVTSNDVGVSDGAYWMADSENSARIVETGPGSAALELTGTVRYGFASHVYERFDQFRAAGEPWGNFFSGSTTSPELDPTGIATVTASVDPGSTLWLDAVLEYGESADALQTTVITCELKAANETSNVLDLRACSEDLDLSNPPFTMGWLATETWTTTFTDPWTTPTTYHAGDRLRLAEIGTIETLVGIGFRVEGGGAAEISRVQMLDADISFALPEPEPEIIEICQIGCAYDTIAAGIAAAAEGDIVEVAAGAYAGGIALNKAVTLRGAGSDGDPSENTVILGTGAGVGITTSNGSADARTVIENIHVSGFGTGVTAGSYTTLNNVTSTENTTYGLNLSGAEHTGLRISDSTISFNATGVKLGSTASARDIEIVDTHFDDNTKNGWYSDKNVSGDSQLDNVTVTRSTFDRNGEKGFYTEKLSNATFTDVTANGSGHDRSTMGNGININLKAGDYSDIVFDNLTVVNSGGGQGEPLGAAVDIEARNDGSYAANPATLTGLVLDGGAINGSEVGLIIGGDTTGAVVTGMDLSGNAVALHNENGGQITATHNFWGSANPNFSTIVSGDVKYSPWWKNAEMAAQPTSIALSLSSSTMARGDSNTRAVASITPAAQGTVQFFDDGAPLGAPVAVDKGAASRTLSTLSAGSHSITAQFIPNDTMNYIESPVSAARTIIVNVPNPEPAPAPAADSEQLQQQIQSGAVPTIPPSSFSAFAGNSDGNTNLQSLDPSKPLQGEIPWADDSDSYVDVYAYSTPVFLGTFPVVNGQVQLNLTPAQLQLLEAGGHQLVFIGQTSGTTMAMAIAVADSTGGLSNTGASEHSSLLPYGFALAVLGALVLAVPLLHRRVSA